MKPDNNNLPAKRDPSAVARRELTPDVRAKAEEALRLIQEGRPYMAALKEAGMTNGIVEMVCDNDPELWARFEAACATVKKMARHVVLGEVMRQVSEGSMHEMLDKAGNPVALRSDVPVQALVKVLEGVDRDFKRKSDAETRADSVQPVIFNISMPENAMLAIRAGNSDVVAGAVTAAKARQDAARVGKVVDVTPVEKP